MDKLFARLTELTPTDIIRELILPGKLEDTVALYGAAAVEEAAALLKEQDFLPEDALAIAGEPMSWSPAGISRFKDIHLPTSFETLQWNLGRAGGVGIELPTFRAFVDGGVSPKAFGRIVREILKTRYDGDIGEMSAQTEIRRDELTGMAFMGTLPTSYREVVAVAGRLGVDADAMGYAWMAGVMTDLDDVTETKLKRIMVLSEASAIRLGKKVQDFSSDPHARDLAALVDRAVAAGFDEGAVHSIVLDYCSTSPELKWELVHAADFVGFYGNSWIALGFMRALAAEFGSEGRLDLAAQTLALAGDMLGRAHVAERDQMRRLKARRAVYDEAIDIHSQPGVAEAMSVRPAFAYEMLHKMEEAQRGIEYIEELEDRPAGEDAPHWMDEILVGIGERPDTEVFTEGNMARVFARVYDKGLEETDMRFLGSLFLAYGNSMRLASRMSFHHLLEIERAQGRDYVAVAGGETQPVMIDDPKESAEKSDLAALMNEAAARLGSKVPQVAGQMDLREAARLANIAIISGIDPERAYSTVAAYYSNRGKGFAATDAMVLAEAYAQSGSRDWSTHILGIAIACGENNDDSVGGFLLSCCAANGLSAMVGKGTHPAEVIQTDVSVREYLWGQRRHFYDRAKRHTKARVPGNLKGMRSEFRDEAQRGLKELKRDNPRRGSSGIDPATGERAWFAYDDAQRAFGRVAKVEHRPIRYTPRWKPIAPVTGGSGMAVGALTTARGPLKPF